MKRRLFKLALFLTLGAIVNVAVCWIIAARPIPLISLLIRPREVGHSDIERGGHWDTDIYNSFGRVRLSSSWIYEWQGRYSWARTSDQSLVPARELVPDWAKKIDNIQPSEINSANIYAEATGWPFLAMLTHYEQGRIIKDASGKSYIPSINRNGIVITTIYESNVLILPLQPIWPGFAINTIFYAAIVWLLTLGPFTARRMIRRKRGLCIKCGYDLRGTSGEVCPECGNKSTAPTI